MYTQYFKHSSLSLSLSLCITFALSISLTHFLMRSLSARARCPNRRRKYPQQFQSKILFSKTNFSTFKMIFTNCGRTQFDQKVLIFFQIPKIFCSQTRLRRIGFREKVDPVDELVSSRAKFLL